MLILDRKPGEALFINGTLIEVRVLKVSPHGKVTLGIDAPPEIPVHREELQAQMTVPVSLAKPTLLKKELA